MAITQEMINHAEKLHQEALQIVRDLCKLPAPSHHEELRAEYCRKWFTENGFRDVTVDDALNVLAPVNFELDSIIFASDYPYESVSNMMKFMDSLDLSPEDQEKVFHLNAEKYLL